MTLQPGDVVIVLHLSGQVSYWEQDTPDVLEYLDNVAELSTCDCPGDVCQQEEMDRWRQQLAEGRVVPEQLVLPVPGMLTLDLDPDVLAWGIEDRLNAKMQALGEALKGRMV